MLRVNSQWIRNLCQWKNIHMFAASSLHQSELMFTQFTPMDFPNSSRWTSHFPIPISPFPHSHPFPTKSTKHQQVLPVSSLFLPQVLMDNSPNKRLSVDQDDRSLQLFGIWDTTQAEPADVLRREATKTMGSSLMEAMENGGKPGNHGNPWESMRKFELEPGKIEIWLTKLGVWWSDGI